MLKLNKSMDLNVNKNIFIDKKTEEVTNYYKSSDILKE